MQIRLTRKLADAIDGIDVSGHAVGDVIDLPQHDATILVAEGWAASAGITAGSAGDRRRSGHGDRRAPDASSRRTDE
jgi:hypothetical protein